MVSFIVIGRNEGWKLSKCLNSILLVREANKSEKIEIIYVDSDSTDDSLERARRIKDIRIFKLKGEINAAISRNVGAKESKGDLLIFLDGDMEFIPGFIEEAISLHRDGHKYIGGQVEEFFYDRDWNLLDKVKVFGSDRLDRHNFTNGGGFVIEKELWNSVNGMKTKYDRSQDIDFIYRLIKKGFPIFRSGKTMFIHHTIQYNHDLKHFFAPGKIRWYLFKGLLIREHIFNFRILGRNLRINYSLFILLTIILFALVSNTWQLFIFYFFIVIFRSLYQYKRYSKSLKTGPIAIIIKVIFIDLAGITGMLLFYPRNKAISYISE